MLAVATAQTVVMAALHCRPRSMCLLPMINPRNKVYKVWAFMLIALDAIYTAFIVPVSVGFRVSDTQWNWVAVTDFTAGTPASGPCSCLEYTWCVMLRWIVLALKPHQTVDKSIARLPAL